MSGMIFWYIITGVATCLKWITLDTFYLITFIFHIYLHYCSSRQS